jgi:hypothetical protein
MNVVTTQASFPNLQSFGTSPEFCIVLKKVVRSCRGDRRPSLDSIYPDLCNITLNYAKNDSTEELRCLTSKTTGQNVTLIPSSSTLIFYIIFFVFFFHENAERNVAFGECELISMLIKINCRIEDMDMTWKLQLCNIQEKT